MESRTKRLLRLFVLALLASTFWFAAQITVWVRDANRYSALWTWIHDVALLADIVLVALLAFAIDRILEACRLDRLRRAYVSLYPVALAWPLVYLLMPALRGQSLRMQSLWALAAIAVALYVGRWTKPLRIFQGLALVLTPVIPILFFQLLTAPHYGTLPEPMRFPRPARDNARPVLLVVFDEWSYPRSTQDGDFLPALGHLRSLSRHAFFFRHAQSEAFWTHVSVPRILFQTDGKVEFRNGETWVVEGTRRTPSRQRPSLLALARDHGYNACALGFYVPYRHLLGNQADCTFEVPKHGATLLQSMQVSLRENLSYLPEPFSVHLRGAIAREHMVEATEQLNRETLRLIEQAPRNVFAFIHAPGAHSPRIFRADGSRHEWPSSEPEAYLEQVRFLDRLVGQLIGACRDAGKYEDALIIVTSDHSWRFDPDRRKLRASAFHVPLVIKWPGQMSAQVVDRPFSLIQLGPLIELALRGGSEQQAADLIAALPPPKQPRTGRVVFGGSATQGLR